MPAPHTAAAAHPIVTARQLSLRHARALGCADANITHALIFCKYPGDDFDRFVLQMHELLTSAQAEIEAYANGKGEEAELHVIGSLSQVTGGR